MKQDLLDMLAELKDLWSDADGAGLNVKAKKAAVEAAQQQRQLIVDFVEGIATGGRKDAIADELATHAQHYWDMAAMYDRTRGLAEKSGEEGSGLIAEATMQVCRDVARRLKARAAEVRGIDPAEAAFRDEVAAEALGGEDDRPSAG